MIGKIHINGCIGSFDEEKGIELIDVISQVRQQPKAESFEVYINSDGGVVDTGFDIYNFLKSLGVPITTIGQGMVASIATVIFMAGSKRIIKPNTQFMIHLPMGGIDYATADEMEMHAKHVRMVENNIIQFYSKELGLNKEAIAPLLRNETWLDQAKLIALGFVTADTNIKIAARATKLNKSKINTMSKPKSKLKAIMDIIRGVEVVNKVIYSADNKELNFPDLTEDDPIEVGAKATYDGMPAEGEITTADGKVYVFEAGLLTEIKDESIEDEVSEDEVVEVLQEMQTANETLATEKAELTAKLEEVNAKLATANQTIAKLKGTSKTVDTKPVQKNEPKVTQSDMVAKWKADKLKKQTNN